MNYYFSCMFLDSDGIPRGRNYIYKIKNVTKNFPDLLGHHINIELNTGYNYGNAILEVTGQFFDDSDFWISEFKGRHITKEQTPIPIKEVCKYRIIEASPIVFPIRGVSINLLNDIDKPITFTTGNSTKKYRSVTELYNDLHETEQEKNENNENSERKKNMNNIFGNLSFGKYNGNEIRYSFKGLSYQTKDNRFISYDKEKKDLTDVTEFTINGDSFLYLLPVAIKDIKTGDIIKVNSEFLIVEKVQKDSNKIEVICPSDRQVKTIIPEKNIFGFDFVTKIVSILDRNILGTPDKDNPFGNNFLMYIMMQDNFSKNEMLPLLMMNNSINFEENPWMFFLFSNISDSNNLLPLLLMNKKNIL